MFLHNQFSFDDRLQLPRDKNSNLVSKLLRLETLPRKLLPQKIKRFEHFEFGDLLWSRLSRHFGNWYFNTIILLYFSLMTLESWNI